MERRTSSNDSERPERARELFVGIEQWLNSLPPGDYRYDASGLSKVEIEEIIVYFNKKREESGLYYVDEEIDPDTRKHSLGFHLLPKKEQ